ncbi:MAG: response regulator [Candidatus Obscuribacterales bacterium]|nr:response regulator [Candidatus Obscuribacterales bacterium]
MSVNANMRDPRVHSSSDSSRDILPVLLVEDNPINQKVATLLLDKLGLNSVVAANGKEAVEVFSQRRFSVILMDCQMPEMDGFQATVAIRKLEALSGTYTPIIAVTALAMAGDQARCIASGMDDYIPKPIDHNLLRLKLNHWLQADVVYSSQKLARKYTRDHNDPSLDEDPINVPDLQEFYSPDQLNEMLSLFLAQTEDMLKRTDFFVKQKDAKAVAGLAHELRASCASIGAKHLARACLCLEQAAGQQDWPEAADTIKSIQTSRDRLKAFIANLLTQIKKV